jgi:hypothetical protein
MIIQNKSKSDLSRRIKVNITFLVAGFLMTGILPNVKAVHYEITELISDRGQLGPVASGSINNSSQISYRFKTDGTVDDVCTCMTTTAKLIPCCTRLGGWEILCMICLLFIRPSTAAQKSLSMYNSGPGDRTLSGVMAEI